MRRTTTANIKHTALHPHDNYTNKHQRMYVCVHVYTSNYATTAGAVTYLGHYCVRRVGVGVRVERFYSCCCRCVRSRFAAVVVDSGRSRRSNTVMPTTQSQSQHKQHSQHFCTHFRSSPAMLISLMCVRLRDGLWIIDLMYAHITCHKHTRKIRARTRHPKLPSV